MAPGRGPQALAGLVHLLKAPKKAAVLRAFNLVFLSRDADPSTRWRMPLLLNDFALSEEEAHVAYDAILQALETSMYAGQVAALEQELSVFTPPLDVRLVALVLQIVTAQLPQWMEASTVQRPSLPRLVGMDWRVDLKVSCKAMRRLPPLPSLQLQLDIEEQPTHRESFPQTNKVEVEVSREALGTLLEGMRRIRDQLGRVAESGEG